jgi:DNA-binding LacI/PurR family transcriptional regulator
VSNSLSHDVVGLVTMRPARMLSAEPFFIELVAGAEEVLAPAHVSLLLHLVNDLDEEIATYRRWSAHGTVGVVIVTNLQSDDPRPTELRRLDLPFVLVGAPRPEDGTAQVWIDNARPAHDVVDHLAALGHRHIARVSGPAAFAHTATRTAAFDDACARAGVEGRHVEGDYTEVAGGRATAELLATTPRPTAIVYDNDVMALAGLAVAHAQGLRVPQDLSLVAWDDSTLCRLASPPLSVMHHDVHSMGGLVGEAAVDLLAGVAPSTRTAPFPRLLTRGSTAPPGPA